MPCFKAYPAMGINALIKMNRMCVCERVSVSVQRLWYRKWSANGNYTAHIYALVYVCVWRMLCKRVRGIEYRQKLVNGFWFTNHATVSDIAMLFCFYP